MVCRMNSSPSVVRSCDGREARLVGSSDPRLRAKDVQRFTEASPTLNRRPISRETPLRPGRRRQRGLEEGLGLEPEGVSASGWVAELQRVKAQLATMRKA